MPHSKDCYRPACGIEGKFCPLCAPLNPSPPESNIERDRRKRSLIDTPPHPPRYTGPKFVATEMTRAPIVPLSREEILASVETAKVVDRGHMIFELAGEYDFESGITTQPHWRPGDHVVATIVVDDFNRERRTYRVGHGGVLERIPALPWRVEVSSGLVIDDPHSVEDDDADVEAIFTPTGGADEYRVIFGGSNFDTSSDARLMETVEIDRAALDRLLEPDDLTITYDDGGPNRAPLEWEIGGIYSSDRHVDMNRRSEWRPGDIVGARVRISAEQVEPRAYLVGADGHLTRIPKFAEPSALEAAFGPTEFRTRPGKLKPGSLDENLGLVGNDGCYYMRGPVEVRIDNLKTARLLALEDAGWQLIDQTYGRDEDGLVATFARYKDFIG